MKTINEFENCELIIQEIEALYLEYKIHVSQASNLIPDTLMTIDSLCKDDIDETKLRLYCLYAALTISLKTCDYSNDDRYKYDQYNHLLLRYYEQMQEKIEDELKFIHNFVQELTRLMEESHL